MSSATQAVVISGDLSLGATVFNLPAGTYEVLAGTHIYVPAGIAFTFDPGVNIYFENNSFLETDHTSTLTIGENSMYVFETAAFVWLRGSLFINGTAADPVLFDKSFLIPGQQWTGIIMDHCYNETVYIQHCIIKNTEKFTGTNPHFLSGAIYIDSCNFNSFEILKSEFIHNQSSDYGGGVCINNSFSADNFTFNHCFFKDNSSGIEGGALASYNSDNEFYDCTFDYNQSLNGGGLYLENCNLNRIEVSKFHKNTGTNAGGGVLLSHDTNMAATAILINSEFYSNQAPLGGAYFSRSYESNLNFDASNNKFKKNQASNLGGGLYIYNDKTSLYKLKSNQFLENTSNGSGGGLATTNTSMGDYDISANKFENNYANYGGAIAFWSGQKINLSYNSFTNNTAKYYGGGFYGEATFNTIEITWNIFDGNLTENYDGGAIALYDYSVVDPLVILLNKFENNEATANGGAIASVNELGGKLYFLNNLIANNMAGNKGGGVYCESHYYFENNTIADNTAATNGGGIFASNNVVLAKHFNNILWNNTPNQGNFYISAMNYKKFRYSCIQGSGPSLTNISANPLFTGSGDYHLQTTSPCINTGKPGFSTTSYSMLWKSDIDVETRIYSTIEMGFDEIMQVKMATKSSEIFEETKDMASDFSFEIYPNPASNYVNVNLKETPIEIQKIRLIGINGNLIGEYDMNGKTTQINLEDVPNGLYILQTARKTRILSVVR